MKNSLKRASLLWLSLIWAFWMIPFINVTNWATNDVTIQTSGLASEHKTRLHSLYLWNGTELTGSWLKVSTWKKILNVGNGIAVNSNSSNAAVIGWWESHTVSADDSWIWWWVSNKVFSSNSAIGWWKDNMANGWNSVVVWWFNNTVNANGVVAWWQGWVSSNGGVVLGWIGTKSSWNGIALWNNAEWWAWSFAWRAQVWDNSARINAPYGLLVWTTTPISNVPLVVDWSVKVGSLTPSVSWEIGHDAWCIKANDGVNNIVLGRSSWAAWNCGQKGSCQFGWVSIQHGDTVTAYSSSYSTNCDSVKRTGIVCSNWKLELGSYIYPYCYQITSDPVYKW